MSPTSVPRLEHIAGAAYADETGRPHHTRIADAFSRTVPGIQLRHRHRWAGTSEGDDRSVPFETVVERGAARGVIIGVDATVSGEAVRQLCCDAELNRVVTRGRSAILDYGTTTRLASDSQYYAMVARDGGCRWPGCDRPPGWCEAHHFKEVVKDDGPTDIDQMGLFCSAHHHYLHQPGWELDRRHPRSGDPKTRRNTDALHHAADQHSPTHNNSNSSTHDRDVANRE